MEHLYNLFFGILNFFAIAPENCHEADGCNPGIVLIMWLIPGLLCAFTAAKKRRNTFLWATFGLVGGISVFIILSILKGQRACPSCKKQIPSDTRTCGYCGTDL
jgi:uncharacterized membrane protein